MGKARREPRWLTLDVVRALHDEQIVWFGGGGGDLQATALEAALARPLNTFAYRPDADLAEFAALYLVGLVNAHAFVDGNKRIGLAAMLVFLTFNGTALHVPQADLYGFVLGVATARTREADGAAWLRARIAPLTPA